MVDLIVFLICAVIILGGAAGVITSDQPVRAALSLVAAFFGVAVLFVQQSAHFLAVVQVVVYAGAIVVLFLFVIMLLGVDSVEDIDLEPLAGQRRNAAMISLAVLALTLGGLFLSGRSEANPDAAVALTGRDSRVAALPHLSEQNESVSDVNALADDLFTRNVVAFEATALLLTVATVAAVVMVRNRGAEDLAVDEPGTAAH